MKAIADALVYAVAYINLQEGSDDDADVGALESICSALRTATDEELDALAAAAKRALAAEKPGFRREDSIRCYSTWMEDVFGEGWTGNVRA